MQRGPGWDGAGVHGGRGPPGGVRQHKADVFRVPPRPVGESVSAVCVLCGGLCASALSSLCIRPSFPDARAVSIPVPAGHAESYTRQQMGWERKFIGSTKFKSNAAAGAAQTPPLAGWCSWSKCHMLATEVPKMLARAFLELPWAAVAHPWTRTWAVSRRWTQHHTRFTDAAFSSVRHVLWASQACPFSVCRS